MEPALGNSLIVSKILSFISFDESLLDFRLISKFWNEQVLAKYSKTDNIFLNLKQYVEQRQRKWHLTAKSHLPKRVFVKGEFSLRAILNFFSCHDNVETIRLYTSRHIDLRKSLLKMFQEGLCPKLKHLIIEEFSEEGQFLQQNIDANLIPNIKTLSFSHTGEWESFSVFAQTLLDILPNLDVLRIGNTKSLPTVQPDIKLKELVLTSSTLSKDVTGFEQLLQQLSPTLEVLKLGTEMYNPHLQEINYNLPTMPKLKTFCALDIRYNPFPLGGDLILFINKNMPSLETLEIGDHWTNRICREAEKREKYNQLLYAISRSAKANRTLQRLSVPGPTDLHFIQEIKKKFTALNKITIALYNIPPQEVADEIAELAFALPNSGVRNNVVRIYCMDVADVEEKATEAIKTRCNQKTFRSLENVFFPRPGEEDSTNIRIKAEKPWCQLDDFGFRNC